MAVLYTVQCTCYVDSAEDSGESHNAPMRTIHRKRIKTEEKSKVVASVWGEEYIQFHAALAVLPRTILNNRMNCNSHTNEFYEVNKFLKPKIRFNFICDVQINSIFSLQNCSIF